MYMLNQNWKGSTLLMSPPNPSFSQWQVGGEQLVIGPGFAQLHRKLEEVMGKLPLCFPGLWIMDQAFVRTQREEFTTPHIQCSAQKLSKEALCHSAIHNHLPILCLSKSCS